MDFPIPYGKYLLLERLAIGGMGEIFRAKTVGIEGFEKEVAIKRLLPEFANDEDVVKMFIDEAHIAAKLQHANIAQILDFSKAEETYYIAMEYIDGRDLKRVIEACQERGRRLTIPQVLFIAMEVCKALQFAHAKAHKGRPLNIVHRDVSPHNIMVTYSGEVKLMDFGIVKADRRQAKTAVGVFKGKTAYMAPEQVRGRDMDKRADIFSLGAVLWEALVGEQLFRGETDIDTLSRMMTRSIPSPRSSRPEIEPELERIVMRALEREVGERYQDCGQMMKELGAYFYGHVEDPSALGFTELLLELFGEERQQDLERRAEEKTLVMAGGQDLDEFLAENVPTRQNPKPRFTSSDAPSPDAERSAAESLLRGGASIPEPMLEVSHAFQPFEDGPLADLEVTTPMVKSPLGLRSQLDEMSPGLEAQVEEPESEMTEDGAGSSPELVVSDDEASYLELPRTIPANMPAIIRDETEEKDDDDRAETIPLDVVAALTSTVEVGNDTGEGPVPHVVRYDQPVVYDYAQGDEDDESWMPSRVLVIWFTFSILFVLAAMLFLWFALSR